LSINLTGKRRVANLQASSLPATIQRLIRLNILLQERRRSLLALQTIRHAQLAWNLLSLVHSSVTVHRTLQGFGWAIAKALAEAGAEISLGVWVSNALPVTVRQQWLQHA